MNYVICTECGWTDRVYFEGRGQVKTAEDIWPVGCIYCCTDEFLVEDVPA